MKNDQTQPGYDYQYLLTLRLLCAARRGFVESEAAALKEEAVRFNNRSTDKKIASITTGGPDGNTLQVLLSSKSPLKSPAKSLRSFSASLSNRSDEWASMVRRGSLFRSARTPELLDRPEQVPDGKSDICILREIVLAMDRRGQEDLVMLASIQSVLARYGRLANPDLDLDRES